MFSVTAPGLPTLIVLALSIGMGKRVAEAKYYDAPLQQDYSALLAEHQFGGIPRSDPANLAFPAGSNLDKYSGNPKIGTILNGLLLDARMDAPAMDLLTIQNGKVLVDVAGSEAGRVSETLEAAGAEITGCFLNTCSAYVPIPELETVADSSDVRSVQPYIFTLNAGSVTSEGDSAMFADDARAAFGVNGTGLKIGVLSDSYDCKGGAAADIASGDLPGGAGDIDVLADPTSDVLPGCSDEGRAMMQLIHDVAPGAKLAFHTAVLGAADFAEGIVELANAGCDIIVDDIGVLTQPFFQDGVIARAADEVATRGIPFFSAAGNLGRNAWDSPNGFIDSGVPMTIDGVEFGTLHEFGRDGSDSPITSQRLKMPNVDFDLRFVVQWNEPFGSLGGSGSASDLDIFFVSNNEVVAPFLFFANVGFDAYELIDFNPRSLGLTPDDITEVEIMISLVDGPAPSFLKIIPFDLPRFVSFENATNSSTCFGHPNAAGAAGIGAANFSQTPEFGVEPPVIEAFSSAGGTPIFFDTSGNRLATPEIRNQPRVTAPDGTSTTFFGDESFRFFGTSAAAPHAAAVAALMIEAAGFALSSDQVYTILENTAVDMDDPSTSGPDDGFDFGTGHGLVDALAAVTAAASASSAPAAVPATAPTEVPSSAPTAAPATAPTNATEEPSSAPAAVPAAPPTDSGGSLDIWLAAAIAAISAAIGYVIGDLLDDGCLFGNGDKKKKGRDSRDGWCLF